MNKKSVKIICSLVALSLFGCNKNNNNNVEVNDVSINLNVDDLYLLKNEKLTLKNSNFVVLYSDNSSKNFEIDSSSLIDIDYTVGSHKYTVTSEFDYHREFDFTYYVFSNSNDLSFIKRINQLPYINNLTIGQVDEIIDLVDAYNGLISETKNALTQNFASSIDRLFKSEAFLISSFYDEKLNELNSYYKTLILSSYEPQNISKINGYINSFKGKTYSSLNEVISEFNETLENIQNIEQIEMSLPEYKLAAYDSLKNLLVSNLYEVSLKGANYVFEKKEVDFSEINEVQNRLIAINHKITAAASKKDVNEVYQNNYYVIEQEFVNRFVADAKENLKEIFESLSLLEKELLTTWNKNYISVDGLFNNISTSMLDDNRWWIPQPFKPVSVYNAIDTEFNGLTTFEDVTDVYLKFVLELSCAVLQKNLENYYSIWRNLNRGYDTTDKYYWNIVADYNGDTPDKQFIYNGVLSEFRGNVYGNTSSSGYRLASFFFNENTKLTTPEAVLEKYYDLRTAIAPDPLAIKNISITKPAKTIYLLGDELDFTGGNIFIEYNDLETVNIAMDTSMLTSIIDMDSVGSKDVSFVIKDSRLGQDINVSFSISVLSNNEKFNNIIVKINALTDFVVPSMDNVNEISDILADINGLSSGELTEFTSDYAAEYNKVKTFEEKCVSLYSKQALKDCISEYEKINYYSYSASDIAQIESYYTDLINAKTTATSFAEIDAIANEFAEQISVLDFDSSFDLTTLKSKSILSLDRVCSYDVYSFGGLYQGTNVTKQTLSLKSNETINQKYEALVSKINTASSTSDVITVYNEGIDDLYDSILNVYSTVALTSAKNSMFEIRSTLSGLWSESGVDILIIPGEASGSEISTDYTLDYGYYTWYIPTEFGTGYIYKNATISNCLTKYDIYIQYENVCYEIARATFNRNLVTALCYGLAHGKSLMNTWWSIMYCTGDAIYDGIFDEFIGKVYPGYSFRLWNYGWNPDIKTRDFTTLVEKYNYDVNLLIG